MVEQAARTFICSVVFVDLVEFSRKSNAEQVLVKETCNALAAEALESIDPDARIVIDTGDGFAITFLGDPEDALLVGLKLRDGIEEAMSTHSVGIGRGTANGHVRIGINLGPVKLGTNFNGHVNIVGDGINVAERIMGFALPGQMLVSRSFHDMVSRLAEEYGKLLTFDGTRTDNNSRVHALYVAGKGDAALRVAEARAAKRHGSATATTRIIAPIAADAGNSGATTMRPFVADSPPPHFAPSAAAASTAAGGASWLHDRFKVGFVALLLLVAAGFQSSLLLQKWRGPSTVAAAGSAATAAPPPAVIAESPTKIEAPPVAPPAADPVPVTAKAPVVAGTQAVPANISSGSPAASSKAAPKTSAASSTDAASKPVEPPPKPVSRPIIVPTPPTPNVVEQTKAAPAPANRPGISERKPEPAREEKTPPKRQPAPQGLQLPAPSISAPPTSGAKVPAAATPPVDTTAQPAAPERAREPARAQAPSTAVVKRSGAKPEFPREATREGLTRGSVRVKVLIDGAGNVRNVDILESRPSRVFDRTVRRSLMEWKFNAGADNRTYEAEIDFKQDN